MDTRSDRRRGESRRLPCPGCGSRLPSAPAQATARVHRGTDDQRPAPATIGGDCPDDIGLLADDGCLERGLGYRAPKATAVRYFLEQFHDQDLEDQRPPPESQLSFIVPSSSGVQGLQEVQARRTEHRRARTARSTAEHRRPGCHPHATSKPYASGRARYQPMIALWAEAELVVDQFRDGNVPAKQEPLSCARCPTRSASATFAVTQPTGLLQWLSAQERHASPAGESGSRSAR